MFFWRTNPAHSRLRAKHVYLVLAKRNSTKTWTPTDRHWQFKDTLVNRIGCNSYLHPNRQSSGICDGLEILFHGETPKHFKLGSVEKRSAASSGRNRIISQSGIEMPRGTEKSTVSHPDGGERSSRIARRPVRFIGEEMNPDAGARKRAGRVTLA